MGLGTLLENLFFLATILGTVFILGWIVLRIIAGVVRKLNDSLMIEIRLNAGMRHTYLDKDDKLYSSLLKYLGQQLGDDYRNRTITLESRQEQNGKENWEFISQPGYGIHYVQFGKNWVRIERRQTPEIRYERVPFEFLSMSTYRWNRQLIYDILGAAKKSQRDREENATSFYAITCGDWESFGEPKRRRLLTSVITAEGVKERLLQDIKEFLNSEEWYFRRGIPYRRGYLLHGPPGTGKTSLIRAIAGEIGYDICILNLSAKDLTDDALNRYMNCTPEKSIILLEDVESAFKSDQEEDGRVTSHVAYEGQGASYVTFRGLLNALDGVASTEGRIVFVTTNNLEKLDPALIRPGRVDMQFLLDYPNASQILEIFKVFYPKASGDMADTFLHVLMNMDRKISMVAIQGLFMLYKKDPDEMIANAEDVLNHRYFGKVEEPQIDCDKVEVKKKKEN